MNEYKFIGFTYDKLTNGEIYKVQVYHIFKFVYACIVIDDDIIVRSYDNQDWFDKDWQLIK